MTLPLQLQECSATRPGRLAERLPWKARLTAYSFFVRGTFTMMRVMTVLLLSCALTGTASSQFVINESFETATFPPAGWTETEPISDLIYRTTDASGYGIGTGSMKSDFWNVSSSLPVFFTSPTIIGLVSSDTIKFDYAYGAYSSGTPPDSLYVLLSTDGGATFAHVLGVYQLPDIATAPPLGSAFVPAADEWGTLAYQVPPDAVGNSCVLRFVFISAFGNNLYIDNIRVGHPSAADLGVWDLTKNPGGIVPTGTSVTLMATVRNFGTSPQSGVPVSYSVNGGAPVGPVFASGPIAPNETEVVTFSGANAFVPGSAGTYKVDIFTQMPGDGDASNDTFVVVVNVQTPISSFPYHETFTSPTNWSGSGDFSWGLAIATGPSGSPTDTMPVANFYNIASGLVGFLQSPLLSLPAVLTPNGTSSILLNFYVAHRTYDDPPNIYDDAFRIMVSTDGGVTFEPGSPVLYDRAFTDAPSLSTLPATTANWAPDGEPFTWRHETVDLTQFAGTPNILVAFVGESDFGNNCFIDDVRISVSNNVVSAVVNAPGVVNGNGVSLNFISTSPLTPAGISSSKKQLTHMTLNGTPIEPSTGAIKNLREPGGKHEPELDLSSGGTVYFARYSGTPSSLASPVFATNTTATTQDGSIFTPDAVSTDRWWTITYSGSDYLSTAVYDISIDITTIPGVINANRLYILKRSDETGSWVAISTSHAANILSASGLSGFSQFAIGGDVENPLPIQLSYLHAELLSTGESVRVNWGTISEINNYGFWVEKSQGDQLHYQEIPGSFTPGHGTTNEPQHYSFVDNTVTPGIWYYRLRQHDLDNTVHFTDGVRLDVFTSVKETAPTVFALHQNYPNPFNPSTAIKFSVEGSGWTRLKVYNVLGQEVVTLFNNVANAGQFYEVRLDASTLGSGVYYYSLESGQRRDIKRMVLLR